MKGSLMRQFLTSLVSYGKVTTTEARAKSLKREIERLISRSKDLSLVTRRKALALFTTKKAAYKFLNQVVPQFSAKGGSASGGRERVGGYVRVIKLAHRRGDRAPQARVEFVEEIKEQVKAAKKAPKKAVAKKVTRNAKKREEKRG